MLSIAESIARLCPRELAPHEFNLLAAIIDAHVVVALANGNNASNFMAQSYGQAHVTMESAIVGSILSVGGKHAPITECREFFRLLPDDEGERQRFIAEEFINLRRVMPGFGNSFHKDSIDPGIELIVNEIAASLPLVHAKVIDCFNALVAAGLNLFPNIGLYTAIVAELIGLPDGTEGLIMMMPRLPIWAAAWGGGIGVIKAPEAQA